MPVYLPVMLDVTHFTILVVGGGMVALQKVRGIIQFTNSITVVGSNIQQSLKDLVSNCQEKPFDLSDLKGIGLVYACTNDPEVNTLIKNEANHHGIMVCVADEPAQCDFISPAVFKDDTITIAVSSSGKDVKKAIEIRNTIRNIIINGKI